VVELLDEPHVTVIGDRDTPVEVCSMCGRGTMVERRSRFGPFLACSTFPACKNKRDLQQTRLPSRMAD
jgi:ssDNA-binding Zn-finger/Zn-ribbon topoisomerase 1